MGHQGQEFVEKLGKWGSETRRDLAAWFRVGWEKVCCNLRFDASFLLSPFRDPGRDGASRRLPFLELKQSGALTCPLCFPLLSPRVVKVCWQVSAPGSPRAVLAVTRERHMTTVMLLVPGCLGLSQLSNIAGRPEMLS
jgi:hypothetical protein